MGRKQIYQKEIRNCIQCGKSFEVRPTNGKQHCSLECSRKTVGDKCRKGNFDTCEICNTQIYKAPWEKTKRFCSVECANKGQLVYRIEVKCSNEFCSNIVNKTENEIQKYKERNAKIFCSVKCLNINRSQKASKLLKHSGTKPEIKFKELLDLNKIEYKHQYSVQWKKGWKKWYDFYIPCLNLLIEIDGTYWHGKGLKDSELNEQQLQSRLNDKQKMKLALESGYNIIHIWEDELDKFKIQKLFKIYGK